MKIEHKKNKLLLSIIFSFVIFLLILFPDFNAINKSIQKNAFNYSSYINDEIVVINIDEKTINKLGRFPFDRKAYANLIQNLNKAGAGVIGLDIIFADKTNDDSDKIFADAIKDAGNIILGGGTKDEGGINGVFEKPLNLFSNNNPVGFFDINNNQHIGIVFSAPLIKTFVNGTYEYFGLSVLRKYYSIITKDDKFLKQNYKINENFLKLENKIKIPFSAKNSNEMIINYENQKFKRYSFFDIYDDDSFESIQKIEGKKEFLKNKIVLVGASLRGIDLFKTPKNPEEFGVNIHASFLNTVLNKNFSKYFDKNVEFLIIFLLTSLAIFINLNKGIKNLALSNVFVFLLIIIYFIIIKLNNLILNYPFELILSFLFSAIVSNILKYLFENKDKVKLNKALSEYVSKDIANEILSGTGSVKLEGEKKRIVTFFSDIEGFTTISERFEPENLINYLKDYLTEMSEIIINQKGFINKYEGDAILALWGVFGKVEENISKLACDSALMQFKRLDELNKVWQNDPRIGNIKIRIGINIGDAILGNIGAKGKKIEFTAIGDSVNLASRLEEINKFYGTRLCISENIYNEVKDLYEFKYLDKIRVKGKNNGIDIYELIDYKGNLNQEKLNYIKSFENAIALYQNKNFKEAYKAFEELDKNAKEVEIYKDRCIYYIQNPPPSDWDKVWTMTQK